MALITLSPRTTRVYNAGREGAATDLKHDFRRTAVVCATFGLIGIGLIVLAIFEVRAEKFGDIPQGVALKDILAAGPAWTLFVAGFASISMVVVGVLGIHAANHEMFERSQVLWGLGVAAFGLGITAIPVGLLVDGSRAPAAWVFLVLGVAVMSLGFSECKLEVERDTEQSTTEERAR